MLSPRNTWYPALNSKHNSVTKKPVFIIAWCNLLIPQLQINALPGCCIYLWAWLCLRSPSSNAHSQGVLELKSSCTLGQGTAWEAPLHVASPSLIPFPYLSPISYSEKGSKPPAWPLPFSSTQTTLQLSNCFTDWKEWELLLNYLLVPFWRRDFSHPCLENV